jgi:phosphoribosylanthranilate isomerase
MRTRVKICGITRAQDAALAVELGADAIGLVFHPRSPRYIEPAAAREIATGIPPFVSVVGLFLDPEPHAVERVLGEVPLQLMQFHGDESPADCERYGLPYIKAVSMQGGADAAAYAATYPGARGVLLDAHGAGEQGGSGRTFDWARIPADLSAPLILAGGLGPDNVYAAIRRVRPYAVDVSSGVEADKGVKDPAKMTAFMKEVHRVSCERQ